jgi:signal transduction histidine kinase
LLRPAAGGIVWLLGVWLAAGTVVAAGSDGAATRAMPTRIPVDVLHQTWGVGPWIWGQKTHDKQTCRLWRAFDIPHDAEVTHARIRISVDNGYRLMLDGRQIGSGSDWRSVTEYDLGQGLKPGRHVVAVEAFNDNREAGMQFGLKAELTKGRTIELFSDTNWRIAPANARAWEKTLQAPSHWERATETGWILTRNDEWQERAPTMLMKVSVPPPVKLPFLKSVWFQVVLWVAVAVALLMCLWLMTRLAVQSKAQELLNRERARIARDIHDELGARLTELALEGEVVQTELPEGSAARPKLEALCEKARAVSSAMDEVVWMVNSRRDTLRDFVNFACKHAQRFLAQTAIRCRLDVAGDLPEALFELPLRRNLLLGVKEALNNAVKYSNATEVLLRIRRRGQTLLVVIEDNGEGFDLAQVDPSRNGLNNMIERMKEVGGECRILTRPGAGCQVEFQVPLPRIQNSSRASAANHDPTLAAIRGMPAPTPVPASGNKVISS